MAEISFHVFLIQAEHNALKILTTFLLLFLLRILQLFVIHVHIVTKTLANQGNSTDF